MSVQNNPLFNLSGDFSFRAGSTLDGASVRIYVEFPEHSLDHDRHVYVSDTLQSKLGIPSLGTSDYGDNPSYTSLTLKTDNLQMCKHLIGLFLQDNPSLIEENRVSPTLQEIYTLTANGYPYPNSQHPLFSKIDGLENPPSHLASLASLRDLISQTVVESREKLEPPPREISKVPLRHHQVVKGL